MKQPFVPLTLALLMLSVFSPGISRAQTRIIEDFPLLNQNSNLEDYPNDCGEWAVASILSYWNAHPYYPFTAFDRFLGKDVDPNDPVNRTAIASMAVGLQDVLGYIPVAGNGAYGTDPFRIQEGVLTFCNDPAYGNGYEFMVSAYNNSNPFNNNNIWERTKAEIDQGRPVLFLIAGSISAKTYYSGWNTYELWHYMPVYGYNENLDGRKVLIAASLGNWNSTIYLDVESASNVIGSFPDIWTITPGKDPSEPPVAYLLTGTEHEAGSPAVCLRSAVTGASMTDHVEYEVSIQGGAWTEAGLSYEMEDSFAICFPTSGIAHAEKVWFRSRAGDYFGNNSEWSYAEQYYVIWNGLPEVDVASVPTQVIDGTGSFRMSVHPNPTAGRITLQTEGKGEGPLSIALVDETGRLVLRTVWAWIEAGCSLEVDLASLPSGTYLFLVRRAGSLWVERVIRQ